jgi:hypothetical protein
MPRKNWNPAAVKPSRTANTQDDCPLFKLAAETRNQIYELVFAFELGEDGSHELEDTSESNALSRTCQQIYGESRIMHREVYRDYPNHTFTIDLLDGQHPNAAVAAAGMSKRFFQRIKSFRVHWRADEHNNALTRTCQQIYDESHKMYELDSPDCPSSYTFTIDVLDRKNALASIPDVCVDFFLEMTSFRVNWRADDCNQGKPLRFTSHFRKRKLGSHYWSVDVDMHDEFRFGELAGNRLLSSLGTIGTRAMYGHSSFASRVSRAVYGDPGQEDWIWWGFSALHFGTSEDRRMSRS